MSHLVDIVREMKGEGRKNREIGMAIGMPTTFVENLCFRHHIRRPTSARLDVPIGIRLKLKYMAEAERRNVPLNRLMRQVLKAIADDDLFNAILDDKK